MIKKVTYKLQLYLSALRVKKAIETSDYPQRNLLSLGTY